MSLRSEPGSGSSKTVSGDIVKHGYLYVKRPPGHRWNRWKAWHKKFFVLKDGTNDHCPMLQMFDSQEEGLGSSSRPAGMPQFSLDLVHVVHIGFIVEYHRFPNVLVIVCRGRTPLMLAAEDELAARSWMLAVGLIAQKNSEHLWRTNVCRSIERSNGKYVPNSSSNGGQISSSVIPSENHVLTPEFFSDDLSPPFGLNWQDSIFDSAFSVERFDVEVHPTEASERKGLQGELNMVIFGLAVGLAHKGETECFILWPVAFIRQYGHEILNAAGFLHKLKKTLITLEVGRRCSTGEGVFKFSTSQGQEIILGIKRAFALWSTQKCASLPIKQASSRQGRERASQRAEQIVIGRSVPTTPSLPIRQPWHSCPCTPGRREVNLHNGNRIEDGDDVNYITPIFERSPERTVNGILETSTENSNGQDCSSVPLQMGSRNNDAGNRELVTDQPRRKTSSKIAVLYSKHHRSSLSHEFRSSSFSCSSVCGATSATLTEDKHFSNDLIEKEGYIEVLPP